MNDFGPEHYLVAAVALAACVWALKKAVEWVVVHLLQSVVQWFRDVRAAINAVGTLGKVRADLERAKADLTLASREVDRLSVGFLSLLYRDKRGVDALRRTINLIVRSGAITGHHPADQRVIRELLDQLAEVRADVKILRSSAWLATEDGEGLSDEQRPQPPLSTTLPSFLDVRRLQLPRAAYLALAQGKKE